MAVGIIQFTIPKDELSPGATLTDAQVLGILTRHIIVPLVPQTLTIYALYLRSGSSQKIV